VDGLWRPSRVRETHPPGGRSGVPAGCCEHTESGTPCFALRRRRARRPGPRAAPAGHGRSHFGSSATQPQGHSGAQPSTERISHRTTAQFTPLTHSRVNVIVTLSVRIVSDVCERAAGGGRALCLSSEPSDQGEITSVVAKRKSNERTSFDHLQVQVRIPQSTEPQTTRP